MTNPPSFDSAVRLHQAGNFAEAASIYRQILAQDANHAAACHLLGVIALQTGDFQTAANLIQRAVVLQPREAPFHNNLGNVWLVLGQLDAALASFRAALALRPSYAEAHFNLGLVQEKRGLFLEAESAYRAALDLKPAYPDAWQNLAILRRRQGRSAEAEAAFHQALRYRPGDVRIYFELGNSLLDQRHFQKAAEAFHAAIQLRPDFAEAHYHLGIASHEDGRIEAAVAAYRAALRLQPDHVAALGSLGKALLDQNQVDTAIETFQATLRLQPGHAGTHLNLGNAWLRKEHWEGAANAYRTALRLDPRLREAWTNLGNLLQENDQLDEALAAYERALAICPDYADAIDNLGTALKARGDLALALEQYRKAVELNPRQSNYQSNLIYLFHFFSGVHDRETRQELALWDERYARPLRPLVRPPVNRPDPARRLKIGYVSPDFRNHVIGRNLLPLFRHHDHARFEIFCYASQSGADAITREFQTCADQWREIGCVSDEAVAQLIRADEIDVLVDLSLHLAHNRLLVFARQPAPVQVTFAGYPGSTGVGTIRYRLTDPFLDPPGGNEALYAEESVRLPETFWCFDPLDDRPEVNELPAALDGVVTFGCLTNFSKISAEVRALWARVLTAVPESRLLLLAPRGGCRGEFLRAFAALGISPERVEFLTKAPRGEYLRWYHRIDLVLDTFPYNGHTTSLDALWMGVPVISLTGEHAVSRAGFSQLSNLGLRELAAPSGDEYVRVAVGLARDWPRLASLRKSLRARMETSPLMDAPRFARNIETVYRELWRRCCREAVG